MEILLELVFELFVEATLSLTGTALADLGFSALPGSKEGPRRSRALALAVAAISGILLGGLSWYLRPETALASPVLRGVAATATPFLCGLGTLGIRNWKTRHDRETVAFDHFWPGFLLGLGTSLTRHMLLHA